VERNWDGQRLKGRIDNSTLLTTIEERTEERRKRCVSITKILGKEKAKEGGKRTLSSQGR